VIAESPTVPLVRLLGELDVAHAAVGGQRVRALAAILLLHANDQVSQDRLLDELWDGSPPPSGTGALHVHVSNLRRALAGGPVAIETTPGGYRAVVDPQALDVHVFESLLDDGRDALRRGAPDEAYDALDAALDLWRGDALAEFAYADWAQAHVTRLDELRLAAVEARAEAALAVGRHAEVAAELEPVAHEHPLREGLWALLMLALYRSGRQADALAAYRRVRALLADELGLEPAPELQELQRAILAHDVPGLGGAADSMATELASLRSILVEWTPAVAPAARALAAAAPDAELILIQAVTADPADVAATNARLATATAEVGAAAASLDGVGARVRAAAALSGPADALARLAERQGVQLLVTSLAADTLPALPARHAALLEAAPCDVALHVARDGTGGDAIVVPFGGSEHDWAALEVGASLARGSGLAIKVVAPLDRGEGDAAALLAEASVVLQRVLGVIATPVLSDGVEGLLDEGARAAFVVAGVPVRWRRQGLGLARAALVHELDTPALFVRRGPRPGLAAPAETSLRLTWSLAEEVRA
jgi:DNA-binding SARP family transcriptional activator